MHGQATEIIRNTQWIAVYLLKNFNCTCYIMQNDRVIKNYKLEGSSHSPIEGNVPISVSKKQVKLCNNSDTVAGV
jgi:hypothetical protein